MKAKIIYFSQQGSTKAIAEDIAAGISFGILEWSRCTGDPAKQVGE